MTVSLGSESTHHTGYQLPAGAEPLWWTSLILGAAPEEGVLMGRPSKYPAEFRESAVELVKVSGKTIAKVARDSKVNDTTLGNWAKASQAEQGVPDASGLLPLTAAERAELSRLRRESTMVRAEREIRKSGGLREGVDEVSRFAFTDSERGAPRRHDVVPIAEGVALRLLRLARPAQEHAGSGR